MNINELKNAYEAFKELQKIAKTLHKLDENACNYGLSQRQETREKNLEKRAEELAQELKLHAYHQGDPRGGTLYLVESLPADTNYHNGLYIH